MGSKHIALAGGLTGTPSSVTVDVYGEADPSTKLATIPNGDVSQVGTTNVYQVDLRGTSVAASLLLPKDGEHLKKVYTLLWSDNAANEIVSQERVSGVSTRQQLDRRYRKETPVYPTTAVPSRGITSTVIAAGNPSYLKVEESNDPDDFSSPVGTYYEVFAYDTLGRVSSKTPSTTIPSP